MKLNLGMIFYEKQSLLILGETGVGKSSFVDKLHRKYAATEPLVSVNLAGLNDNLFESEMFGHIKGAFTGASENKEGFIVKAGRGILFLDEIGELTLRTQKKLLGLLEERMVTPVGSTKSVPFRGQIIAATNKDLYQMVQEKTFREDLYYRICGLCIEMKALRDKRSEIQDALSPFQSKLTQNAYEYLINEYEWPGNYRELKQFIQRLKFTKIEMLDLNEIGSICRGSARPTVKGNYYESLDNFESAYFDHQMKIHSGKVNIAAKEMGISKSTLIAKLKKYGINSLKIKAASQDRSRLKIA